MDNFWKEAVKVTGPVAVVGFIIAYVLENVFQKDILEMFGSDRAYYLTVFIIAALLVTLILSVMFHGKKSPGIRERDSDKQSRTVKIERSEVAGDVVLGDKNINQDRKRD